MRLEARRCQRRRAAVADPDPIRRRSKTACRHAAHRPNDLSRAEPVTRFTTIDVSPSRWASAILLCALLPALALAGPLASYVPLPECCRDQCKGDRCPIEAHRAAHEHRTPKPSKEGASAVIEAPSCHAQAEEAAPPKASAEDPPAHSGPTVRAPRDCGSSSEGLTPVPRSEAPAQAEGSPRTVEVACRAAASKRPQTTRFFDVEPRGPPSAALH